MRKVMSVIVTVLILLIIVFFFILLPIGSYRSEQVFQERRSLQNEVAVFELETWEFRSADVYELISGYLEPFDAGHLYGVFKKTENSSGSEIGAVKYNDFERLATSWIYMLEGTRRNNASDFEKFSQAKDLFLVAYETTSYYNKIREKMRQTKFADYYLTVAKSKKQIEQKRKEFEEFRRQIWKKTALIKTT